MKKYKNYIIIGLAVIAFCVTICFVPIDASRLIPTIEKQVTKDLGINIHIEKLILRLGPTLKVKAPVMHVMYEDGQKFGQFDNVKFFVPWASLLKDDVTVKRIYADKFIVKVKSDDKYLNEFLEKIEQKDFDETPDVTFKNYSITYFDKELNKKYKLAGPYLEVAKVLNFKNLRLKTNGEFFINDKKYISYDVAVLPNIEMPDKSKNKIDISNFVSQIENLDFHSDIIADLKLYKNLNGETQISGLVNIDNVSVLDKDKKCPKSFIYLTFLGDKIGVLSNIYATSDKKINIKGDINNSQKPSVDLKIKSDKIRLEDLYNKVKLLVDLSKFKGLKSITGSLAADFSIKGDLNKIKSSGYFKVTDAAIKASGLDINRINSDIDFSNNVINITNTAGYVNNSPIMVKGSIDKNINLEILMNKVELKHLCPASFGVKSGVASLVADITGTFDNIVHKENLQVENFKAVNNNCSLAFSTLKIDTNKNNTAYLSNVTLNTDKTEPIKLPLLKLNIERDSITVPNTNIFMKNSKLVAKADITNYNTKDLTFTVNIDGFVNSKDLKGLNQYSAIYPVKFIFNGNRDVQNLNAQLHLENAVILDEPSIVNLSSKIANNTLKIEDLSVSTLNGKMQNDFKTNLKGTKKVVISGNVEDLQNPTFKNIRVFIPQYLNINAFDTVAQLKGDIFVNGKPTQPEVVGQVTVQNAVNQFMQMAVSNITVDFNKNIAVVNAPQVRIGDSSFGVNSTVSTNFAKELLVKNINIKSKYINTDTFLMYKDSPIMKTIPINVVDGKLYSEKAMATIYGSPLYLSALSANFKLKDNILSIKNMSSEIFNGKLAGNIDFSLRDEHFDTKMQARGVSAAPIFDIISTRKETMSGVMDFDTSLCGSLSSKQSLNGDIRFIVHNGKMGTLGKLEHLLYAQNVIADNMLRTSLSVVTKAITLKDTGLFKYLRGDIHLKDGIANIKMLQSQGPLMTLFIKGQYNPMNDYAKLVVLGRLSDEVISGMGAFGEFSLNKLMIALTGEDTRYNILPEDFEKLPPLPIKNTKEFRSVINGIIDKPSSVLMFNWISYTQKSYRQKDVPMTDVKVPEFIEALPY